MKEKILTKRNLNDILITTNKITFHETGEMVQQKEDCCRITDCGIPEGGKDAAKLTIRKERKL